MKWLSKEGLKVRKAEFGKAHVEPSMADVSDLAIPGAAGLGETRVADKVLSEIEAGKRGTGVVQGAVNGRP